MARIPFAAQYASLLFVPLLVPLLLPVPCLGSSCLLLTAIKLADPSSLDMAGYAGFCAWALGPLPAAGILFGIGLLAHLARTRAHHARVGHVMVWALFCLAALPVAWYLIILLTNVGASETPPAEYLGWTAGMALAAIVLAQPLIVAWLALVDRYWKRRPTAEALSAR